jgi:hypothetical protein
MWEPNAFIPSLAQQQSCSCRSNIIEIFQYIMAKADVVEPVDTQDLKS